MLESARQQWSEGERRLEAEGAETVRARHLSLLVGSVTAELRRRLGQRFTLAELAEEYERAEDWVREVVALSTESRFRAGIRDATLVQDAAFARYAHGASDYSP